MSLNIGDDLAKELAIHIKAYPSQFKSGGDILEFIFCVNGNGFEWIDGEPKAFGEFGQRDDIYKSFQTYLKYYLGKEEETPQRVKTCAIAYELEMKIRSEADIRAKDKRVTSRCIYPLCEYSLINNVPKNITSTWKDAVEIVLEMIQWYPNSYELRRWKEISPLI